MPSPATFPYLAKATTKYKSPHKQDLTFAKGDAIRVTGVAPKTDDDDDDDDDDWLIGETLDGSRSGTFPGGFVEPSDEGEEAPSYDAEATIASAISAPTAPGAISSEAPTDLQSSVIEETPTHQVEMIPEAAREAAQRGETEEAGFGAPLPPRPPSPDANEDDAADDASQVAPTQAQTGTKSSDANEGNGSFTEEASGAAAAGAVAAGTAIGAVQASKGDAASNSSPVEAKADAVQAKSPPAVASKPVAMSTSFRDRLAAFNKPAESAAPPPLPKAKPGGWKRPTPASSESKPLLPGATPAAASIASKTPANVQPADSREAPSPVEPSGGGGAFSAADAQTSIKMSLKERMAALQRNEAAAADTAPQLKPKPSVPGKIGADRRNVALQGMGLAPGAAVPPRRSSVDAGGDAEVPTAEPASSEKETVVSPADDIERDSTEPSATEAGVADETQDADVESGEPKEALTEEEQEAERRAAIAKRMAALGARRMGGGPSPFGAPAPPTRTKTSTSVGSAEGSTAEPGIVLPAAPQVSTSSEEAKEAALSPTTESGEADLRSPASQEAGEEPKILAVPRRTAAPRKKKPVSQAAAATTAAAAATAGGAVAAEESEKTGPAADTESDLVQGARSTIDTAADQEKPTMPDEEITSRSDEPVAAVSALQHDDEDAPQLDAHEDSEVQAASAHQELPAEEPGELDPEIVETQRQLEEYLRGEGFYEDKVNSSAQHEAEGTTADGTHDDTTTHEDTEAEPLSAVDSVPRQDLTSPKPPSRPASTRPPIPKTSLPPPPTAAAEQEDAVPERVQSPSATASDPAQPRRGSLIPPVPTSSLPIPVEAPVDEVEDHSSAAQPAEEDAEGAGPILAAPKPRMAMPTEDPEDEEILAAAGAQGAAGEPLEESQAASEAEAEPEELTEEEQEAQRRADLARRMAALGGQRIGAFPGMAPPPIMGAPMPARKAPVQTSDEAEEQSRDVTELEAQGEQEAPLSPIRGPPRGGMAIPGLTAVPGMNAQEAEGDALERAKSTGTASIDDPVRLASPPPVPTSPPPKPLSPPPTRALPTASDSTSPPPLPAGRPASTAQMANLDDVVRAASPAQNDSSLGRRTSMKPPMPQGFAAHSRESSAVGKDEAVEDRELPTSPHPLPVSPPPLPVSPPPRPASRAPPLPGMASVPPRRQGSSASYADQQDVPSAAPTPGSELPTAPIPARTESSLPPTPAAAAGSAMSVGARQSSRDLDLMPSSRWWRHGLNPLRLPPTVAGRPDAILYADTSSNADTGVNVHMADIFMLFEDYSTTTISLSFQDDDLDEQHTQLTQRHSFPPAKPQATELKQWASSIGSGLAKMAADAAKQSSSPIGDGSPRAFVQTLISQIPTALPPVGSSLGALVLTQVGPTIMEQGADEVRPGDIVSCSQADFRGKKGLAPYHMSFGSQGEPTTGIVVEVEAKKNKLRCIIQSPNNRKGLPDEVSLRLDDLKSGIVKVFRVPSRQGWVNDW